MVHHTGKQHERENPENRSGWEVDNGTCLPHTEGGCASCHECLPSVSELANTVSVQDAGDTMQITALPDTQSKARGWQETPGVRRVTMCVACAPQQFSI